MTDTPGTIPCRRCGEPKPALARAPFRDARGELILATVCRDCWGDWLKHQTQLINHYGLDPREPEARDFLYAQIDQVLLGDDEPESVDTSQEGKISW